MPSARWTACGAGTRRGTERGASSSAERLNKLGYKYKDETAYSRADFSRLKLFSKIFIYPIAIQAEIWYNTLVKSRKA